MKTIAGSDYHVPRHPEVPSKSHQDTINWLNEENGIRSKQFSREAERTDKLVREYQDQAQQLIGKDKYRRFREYIKKERERQAEKLRPPKALEMERGEIQQLSLERKETSLDFLRTLGTKEEQIKSLNSRFAQKVQKTMNPKLKQEGKPGQLVLPEDVPAEIRAHKTNPWTIKTPPYEGWNRYWWVSLRGDLTVDEFSSHVTVSPEAGSVSHRLPIFNINATDFDRASAKYYNAVGFWYQMPRAGLIEVWVEAQTSFNQHHFYSWDEWGWSEWSMSQDHYITMKHPGFAGSGETEHAARVTRMLGSSTAPVYWENSYMRTGDRYWFHFFSDVSYPQNTWLYIQIGSRSDLEVYANDIMVDTWMQFRWFIKSVHIHSTGD